MRCWWLAVTFPVVVLLHACGEGTSVKSDADVDGRPGPEGIVLPDGDRPEDSPVDLDVRGSDGPVDPDVDVWLWDGARKPDGVGPDALPGLTCNKDSDCEGKEIPLLPCEKAVCDKHVGECRPGPKSPGEPCDDLDACTTATACSLDGHCRGMPVFCDDGNLCTTDSCLPDKGCVFVPNENVCDDGNGCTKNDRCSAAICGGEETGDCACDNDDDCVPFEDGNQCNGKVKCVFGTCKAPQSSVKVCADAEDNPCQKSVCAPDTGTCVKIVRENGRPCDDGNACTVADLCFGGTCVGSAPRSCDDSNPCTIDTCDPASGCLNSFSAYPCNDGDGCTVNDHCKYGQCIPGPSNACNPSTCFPKWSLFCGASDVWSTLGEGATDNVKSYSCSGTSTPGPEYTYAFVAPYDGSVAVTLEPQSAGLALQVLEAPGNGCEADNCRATSQGVLNFEMFAGRAYYLVVDGTEEQGKEFSVDVACIPHEEQYCDDGVDEDQDGATDCDDGDCADTAACPSPKCLPIWTLSCNSKDFGANYGLGATHAIVSYKEIKDNKGCLDNEWEYDGPEFAYRFDAPGSMNVTVKLTGETAQTDLLILRDEGQGCRPEECIAWGLKKVTFPAEAGKSYYFVVDGYAGAQGKFDIEVSCPSFVETACHDGNDNDLDMLTDCEDSDCYQAVECVAHCLPAKTVGCGFAEAFANFGWGSTLAVSEYSCKQYVYSGPEVAYRFVPPYDMQVKAQLSQETASTDLIVVEGQLCDPTNCIAHGLDNVTFPAKKGQPYNIIVDGYQAAMGTYVFSLGCQADKEMGCANGADDDMDGATDCQDEGDCGTSPSCAHCSAVYPLPCGKTDTWSNGGDESTDHISHFGCNSAIYDGPEFAYVYEPAANTEVTLDLQSAGWDLDLFVLVDKGYGCNPANCIAWGTNHLTFQALQGNRYFVVIDGYGKAPPEFGPEYGTGEYVLEVGCK
ncbi:MAG: hypothetical protein FJ109_07175 [Deltaproteobacteria bacterium]|nr:hypothetical protein [Deltaproteobacteria bacterium]